MYEGLKSNPLYSTVTTLLSESERLEHRVQSARWLAVITAALLNLGGIARVPELLKHPIVKAAAKVRGRSQNMSQTLWVALQKHAPPDSKTVFYTSRSGAVLFDKDEDLSLIHI